jgi:hypothetical protein
VVELNSGSPERCCPVCGSELVVLKYSGLKPDLLALVESVGFRCFMGCLHVDLHDKVIDGVNHRGKVYVVPVFHARVS